MKNLANQARQLYAGLKEQLAHAWQQPGPAFQNADAASMLCQDAFLALRECFNRHTPCTEEEKIDFFKNVKPLFIAEHLYYNKLYVLYVNWQSGDEEWQRGYLRGWLRRIYHFFEEHKDFCTYYRTGYTDRDTCYFIPGRRSARMMPPDHYFDITDSFTSGYDMLAGTMLANERLQEHLLDKLENIRECGSIRRGRKHIFLPWSGTKVALIELIYALDSAQVIKNGKSYLKEIVEASEDFFQIDLGKYSDVLGDIRARKLNVTRFLDELKAALLRRLNEKDE